MIVTAASDEEFRANVKDLRAAAFAANVAELGEEQRLKHRRKAAKVSRHQQKQQECPR